MTEQEALVRLEAVIDANDKEVAHIKADDLLVDFIRELGYTKLADRFEKASNGFWYA